MKFNREILSRFFTKKDIGGEVSIHDLRDREFSGERLNAEEKQALLNYDKYRISVLNAQTDEDAFHQVYRQLQVVANLGDWREFLKPEYNQE
jgi:hypothetical protein